MYLNIIQDIWQLLATARKHHGDMAKFEQEISNTLYEKYQSFAKSPEPYPTFGLLYPRWAMLSLLFFLPLFLIDDLIAIFTPQHLCVLGLSCSETLLPVWLQVSILLAIFVGLWALALVVGRKPLALAVENKAKGPVKPLALFFWRISAFDRVSALIVGAAIVAVIGMGLSVADHFLTPAGIALAIQLCIFALITGLWWWLLDHPKNNPYKHAPSLEEVSDAVRRNLNWLIPVMNQQFLPYFGRSGHERQDGPRVDRRVHRGGRGGQRNSQQAMSGRAYSGQSQRQFSLRWPFQRSRPSASRPLAPHHGSTMPNARPASGALPQGIHDQPTSALHGPHRVSDYGAGSSPYSNSRPNSPPPPPTIDVDMESYRG